MPWGDIAWSRRCGKAKERFHLCLLATRDGIWDWDITSGETWFNDAYQTHLRPRAEDAEGAEIRGRTKSTRGSKPILAGLNQYAGVDTICGPLNIAFAERTLS